MSIGAKKSRERDGHGQGANDTISVGAVPLVPSRLIRDLRDLVLALCMVVLEIGILIGILKWGAWWR